LAFEFLADHPPAESPNPRSKRGKFAGADHVYEPIPAHEISADEFAGDSANRIGDAIVHEKKSHQSLHVARNGDCSRTIEAAPAKGPHRVAAIGL
jgi:hypothetical protein